MTKFEFGVDDPSDIDITMKVTMTLKQWEDLSFELRKLDRMGGPVNWFINHISKATRWAKRLYQGEDEPEELGE